MHTAIIVIALVLAFLVGCAASPRTRATVVCDVEAVAPHVPAIVEAVERRDYLALANIIDAIGHERAVCALKQATAQPPGDAGATAEKAP